MPFDGIFSNFQGLAGYMYTSEHGTENGFGEQCQKSSTFRLPGLQRPRHGGRLPFEGIDLRKSAGHEDSTANERMYIDTVAMTCAQLYSTTSRCATVCNMHMVKH
eukprot:39691-Amphidinium_carterae.1